MRKDRTETQNLAAFHPGKVKELATLWQQWADENGARAAGNRRYGKDRLGPDDYGR
jgi:hypothetical protein